MEQVRCRFECEGIAGLCGRDAFDAKNVNTPFGRPQDGAGAYLLVQLRMGDGSLFID